MPGVPVELHFTTAGPPKGTPIVLLHGFPLDGSLWSAQRDALTEVGYRVVLPDLRGHGHSPVGNGPATMAAMAVDVWRLADRLGLKTVILGGFSLGGYVALQMYKEQSQRILGLVLAGTRAEPETPEGRLARDRLVEEVRRGGMNVLVETMGPNFLTPATRKESPDLVRRVASVIRQNPSLGAIQALQGMRDRPDQRPLLPRLRVPTLILVGEEDPVTPPRLSEAMAAAIPQAELHVLSKAAHLTPVEAPHDFNRALLAWLSRLENAPARVG